MEYERIHNHKLQVGIISPSKLRMKLMGQRKKDGGSKSNSARTSPSKLEDTEFANSSLLDSNSGVFDDEVSSMGISSVTFDTKENRVKLHQFQKTDSSNSSSVHPIRSLEDENLDYDSNASSFSFEFHKAERLTHNAISRSLLRPMSSKWSDAEKWIINRQNIQNHNTKNTIQNRVNRVGTVNVIKGSSESFSSVKRVDFSQPMSQTGPDKFSFTPSDPHNQHVSGQTNVGGESTVPCLESKDLNEIDTRDSSCGQGPNEDKTGCHEVRAVSMRDMGTEMTPIPSQEPSTTSTPMGSTTPIRSPNSSIPSTPRRGGPTTTPVQHAVSDCLVNPKELTEQEVKLRTRKEILHLGMQLGKMNIAAWASKEDMEKKVSRVGNDNEKAEEESLRIEFEKRAVAWEDAENSKHNARFISEEIKIQAWESQQKAKLEAEMRRIEAEIEQRRANAQAKMLKKIALARQKSEKKMGAAEAQRSKQAARAAAQAEYIRQIGRIPPSSPNSCCGWS